MATPTLSDEHLRALRFLAGYSRGCAETTLLARAGLHRGSARLARLCGACHATTRATRTGPRSAPSEDHRGGTEGDRGVIGLHFGSDATGSASGAGTVSSSSTIARLPGAAREGGTAAELILPMRIGVPDGF
jgi:hypothetical protein